MTKAELIQLMQKYQPFGVVKGGELALPPNDALRLADDVAALGVAIMGADGWYYVDRDKGWIAQDLAVDFSVNEEVLGGDHAVQQSAAAVKKFIGECLPKRTAFISFSLDIPPEWNLFPARVGSYA